MTKYTFPRSISGLYIKKMDQTQSRQETRLNTQIHLREDTQNGYTNK